jgi:ectoine hydroxylase
MTTPTDPGPRAEQGSLMSSTIQTGARTGQDHYPTRVPHQRPPRAREHPTVWAGREACGALSRAELDRHARAGYTVVGGLLSPAEVATHTAEIDRLAALPELTGDERVITEKSGRQPRSIFDAHLLSEPIAALAADPRLAGRARAILGSQVYIHQSRINYMPGFHGSGFYWHSDFETWHAEDGMPTPRAVSISIALTENYPFNGGLLLLPGSHETFFPCIGETPPGHYRHSLAEQRVGVPTEDDITRLARRCGIEQVTGPAGDAAVFDANLIHASSNNITPYSRANLFLVFNSVHNRLQAPFAATETRPEFIAHHAATPI